MSFFCHYVYIDFFNEITDVFEIAWSWENSIGFPVRCLPPKYFPFDIQADKDCYFFAGGIL